MFEGRSCDFKSAAPRAKADAIVQSSKADLRLEGNRKRPGAEVIRSMPSTPKSPHDVICLQATLSQGKCLRACQGIQGYGNPQACPPNAE